MSDAQGEPDIFTTFVFAHCSLYSDDDENMIWLMFKYGRRRWSMTASRVLAHPSSSPHHCQPLKLLSMSIRPLNTLTCDEVFQLLQAPGFYDFLEFAYLMYIEHLVAQFNNFVVRDPPAPAIAPGFNDG